MKNIQALVSLFFAVLMIAPSIGISQTPQGKKFESLIQLIEYAYVDSSDADKLTEKAIRSVLKDLDPHSVYIPKKDLEKVNEPLVGKFEGIGIQFNILDDTIMVTNTISGGPSEKLGIMAGDRITHIDGENVGGTGINNSKVVKLLRGDKGTKVKVDIKRRGESELLDFEITRDKIPLYSVEAKYMVTSDVGYIKISRFANSTVKEFEEALSMLQAKGAKSLILDLTNNGGGYLNRAIEMADEFLSDDKLIVYTEGRSNPRRDSKSSHAGKFEKGKLVVLINESSASASEIVSGAIQDWDRGLVIGRRSFGKGLVQKPYPLPDGSA
ncbi:MAG: S41 family peptidase, partial [Flavobacteriaceae bacterium]|nr:S41 family peptidase [Flavobacteriaceae bacterium]